MAQTLLLRLPAPGQEDADWLTVDGTGTPLTTRQRGPLSLAAAVARSSQVVVIAPATQILLAEPELPPGSGAKLARAVPFALEEQLTEDLDHLVFALGNRRSTGATPVAVVSRSLLQGWLAALDAAGIEPAAIYPDMSLLPSNPGQTVLWLEKSRLSVRHPGKLPFAVEVTPLTEALIVAGIIPDPLAEGGSAEPQSAILYATHEDWAGVADEVEKLTDQFASIKVQLLPDGPLPWLARSLPQTDAVNLLQGEFARTADYGATWRQWRTAAALAVGLLVVHMAAQAVQIRQARHETAQLDGQIARLFSQAMPSEKLHDARKQMQARLERIRHSGPGAEYFLRTLQALSGAMPATGKTSIDSLSYRENSLELKVTAPSLSDLSQLSQQLARQGLTAEIQSSTPVGSTVEAHLQIRTAGSKARP